jgi:hypothetical protein
MNIAITNDGKLVTKRENSYFTVAEPMSVEAAAAALNIPKVSNEGLSSNIPKFPYEQWQQVVGFHRWSYETFKKETHLSHFITRDGEFITLPFHQQVSGMTIEINLKTDENQALLKELEETYGIDVGGFHGTTHNHVAMAAFQSSVDHKDEAGQQGIHFTLGNLNNPEMTIHARVSAVFNGDISLIQPGQTEVPEGAKILKKMITLSNLSILSLIDIPYLDKNFKSMPQAYIDAAVKHYITGIGYSEKLPFPEEWKARVTEKKWAPATIVAGTQPGFLGMVGLNQQARQSYGGSINSAQQSSHPRVSGVHRTGTDLGRITRRFHEGLNTLFEICLDKSKALNSKRVAQMSFKEMLDTIAIVNDVDALTISALKSDDVDFAECVLSSISLRSPADSVMEAIMLDSLAWDQAWKSLTVAEKAVSPMHTFALAQSFAQKFNPLFAEVVL